MESISLAWIRILTRMGRYLYDKIQPYLMKGQNITRRSRSLINGAVSHGVPGNGVRRPLVLTMKVRRGLPIPPL